MLTTEQVNEITLILTERYDGLIAVKETPTPLTSPEDYGFTSGAAAGILGAINLINQKLQENKSC
jgi:ABC-type enterobactin transport system permease subunit